MIKKSINKVLFGFIVFFSFMPVAFSKELDINDYVPDEIEVPMIDTGVYLYNYSQCDLFREYSDKTDGIFIHFNYVYDKSDPYNWVMDSNHLEAVLHEERFCDYDDCIIDRKIVEIKYKEKDEEVYKTINDLVKKYSFKGEYSGTNYIDFLHKAGFNPSKTKIEDALMSSIPDNIKNDVVFDGDNDIGQCYPGGRGTSSYFTAFNNYNYSNGYIKYKDIYYDHLYSYYNYNRVMFLPYGTSYDDIIDVAIDEVKKLDNNSNVTVTKLDKKVGDYYKKDSYYDFIYDNYYFDNEFSKDDSFYDVCIDGVCDSMAIVPKKNVSAHDINTGTSVVAPIASVGEEISIDVFRPDYWDLQDDTYFDEVKEKLGVSEVSDMIDITLTNGINSIDDGFFDISFSIYPDYDQSSRLDVYYISDDGVVEKYDVVSENIDNNTKHLITKYLGKYYIVPAEIVMGDLNDDGDISLSDVLLILKYYFTKEDCYHSDYERKVADINGDLDINLADVLLLLKMYFNKISG